MEKRQLIQKQIDMESKEMKQCPYCGEEILAVAHKCKHCGEWLDEEENSDSDEELDVDKEEEEDAYDDTPSADNVGKNILKRIVGTVAILAVAFLAFEFGGWKIAWGRSIRQNMQWVVKEAKKQGEMVVPKDQGFLLYRDFVLVRVNKKYYGFVKDKRHFDAPAIQWILLPLSISMLGYGIYFLFTGRIPDDD